MEHWNKSELSHHMGRLGCFDAQNAETPICKKLLDLLIPKNESFNYDNSGVNDDYSVVNGIAIASYSLAIFLNCALLWIMYKDPLKRFRTPSALLLANLAISDFLGACFSLAIECEFSQKPRYAPSALTTHYLPWLVATTAQSSYYTVMLVSFERYTAIAHPFRYRVLFITKYTVPAMVISWLLAFAISTPLFFAQDIDKITYTGNPIYAINSFILITMILVLYPLTHSSLRRQRKQILTMSMNASNTKLRRNKMKIEKNFANTMFLVCLSLILCTSPYVVVFFFTTTECNSCILNNFFLHIWMYFRIFFAMHFGVNPVLYAWRLPCYKDSLLNLLPVMKNQRAVGRNHPTAMNPVGRSGASRRNEPSTQSETQT